MSMSITSADRSASGPRSTSELPRTRNPHEDTGNRQAASKRPREDSVLLTVAVADSKLTYTYVMPETAQVGGEKRLHTA